MFQLILLPPQLPPAPPVQPTLSQGQPDPSLYRPDGHYGKCRTEAVEPEGGAKACSPEFVSQIGSSGSGSSQAGSGPATPQVDSIADELRAPPSQDD